MKVVPEQIKAIVFDFDDTLVDEKYWIIERWRKTILFAEEELNIKGFGEYFWEIFKKNGPKYKFHVNDTLEKLKSNTNFLSIIVNHFLSQKVDEKLFCDSTYCLKRLYKNYKLGIITDGKEIIQIERLKNAKILNYFEIIICTNNTPKPNKNCYLECAEKLGYDPKQCVYVSHDIDTDLKGAKKSGYKTVLLDLNYKHKNKWLNQKKLVDNHCYSFKEIDQLFNS